MTRTILFLLALLALTACSGANEPGGDPGSDPTPDAAPFRLTVTDARVPVLRGSTADAASIDAGFYVISSSFPMGRPGGTPHWIACLRPHELTDRTRAVLQAGQDAGHMAWIDLHPLGPEETASLLASLDLAGLAGRVPEDLVETLHDRTGGNALFILETLRNLLETNRLHAPPARLPLGDKVDAIVRQRLSRLSPLAQRVVQAAAVLQSDFDLEFVGSVLNVEPLDLIPAWEELERAQVFRGDRFSHDLLYEAALAGVSRPVAVLLNRRAADALERHGGSPGRIAKHLLAAGDDERAAPWLERTAAPTRAVLDGTGLVGTRGQGGEGSDSGR